MNYYTETFTGSGNKVIHAYGEMGAHDHGQSNQFATDIKAYLMKNGWTHVIAKDFKSNQGLPKNGKLFVWKYTSAKKGHWEKG